MIDIGGAAGPHLRRRAERRRRQRLRRRDRPCRRPLSKAGKRVRRRLLDRRLARPHRPGAGRSRADRADSRSRDWPEAAALRRGRRRAGGARPRSRLRDRRPRRHRRAGHPRRPPGAARAQAPARRTSSPRLTSLAEGDLVVHIDHGIGRFVGLKTIEAAGAPHDCLETHLRRRRPALPAGREHRAPVALRLGRGRGRARQARRRRLAGAQGAAEEAHPRHGGGADQDRRRAGHDEAGAGADPAGGALRRVRGALPL